VHRATSSVVDVDFVKYTCKRRQESTVLRAGPHVDSWIGDKSAGHVHSTQQMSKMYVGISSYDGTFGLVVTALIEPTELLYTLSLVSTD